MVAYQLGTGEVPGSNPGKGDYVTLSIAIISSNLKVAFIFIPTAQVLRTSILIFVEQFNELLLYLTEL